jgi:hypothetical protein
MSDFQNLNGFRRREAKLFPSAASSCHLSSRAASCSLIWSSARFKRSANVLGLSSVDIQKSLKNCRTIFRRRSISCWLGEASHVMLIWLSSWSAMLSAPGASSATVSGFTGCLRMSSRYAEWNVSLRLAAAPASPPLRPESAISDHRIYCNEVRTPMRRIRPDCCARAANGHPRRATEQRGELAAFCMTEKEH